MTFVLRDDKRVQCLEMDNQFWIGESGRFDHCKQIHTYREHHESEFWIVDGEGRLKPSGHEHVRACLLGEYVGMKHNDDNGVLKFKVHSPSAKTSKNEEVHKTAVSEDQVLELISHPGYGLKL